MNWRKIYKNESIPNDEIVYTNGRSITVIGKDIYGKKVCIGDNISLEQATHYMLLREITVPRQKCAIKCVICDK